MLNRMNGAFIFSTITLSAWSFGVSHTPFASAFLRCLTLMTADDFITADFATETAMQVVTISLQLAGGRSGKLVGHETHFIGTDYRQTGVQVVQSG